MRCSILIVNWRNTEQLKSLLRSIEQLGPADREVIVIDNASDDFNQKQMESEFPGVTFSRQSENTGFARGNNIAINMARGEYLALMNPDTELTKGALETLMGFLEYNSHVAIAAPQLVSANGKIQRSCRSFPYPLALLFEALLLSRIFPWIFGGYRMRGFNHKHSRRVDQPMASCWVMPRKMIGEVGRFDESLPILYNDVDYAWRVYEGGWDIWFVAEAQIKHIWGAGTSKAGKRLFDNAHLGLKRVYEKHLPKYPAFVKEIGITIIRIHYRIKSLRSGK